MVTIHLSDNINGWVEGILPTHVKRELVYNCSYEVQGSFFSEKLQNGQWDGFKKFFSAATQRFPLGLLSIIRETLTTNNMQYTVIDHRKKPEYTIQDYSIPGITFYPYQDATIQDCLKYQRGIIQAATGSGKSLMIVALVKALRGLKTNIFVHRNTLLRQLEEDFNKAGIPVGIIGDGERLVSDINICSLQSVLKRTKISETIKRFSRENVHIIEQADMTIWDECHHLVTDLFYSIHTLAKNSYFRFGFSATPWRDDNADITIQAATGRKIVQWSASYLIEQGYLVKPKVYFIKIPSYPGLPNDYRQVYNKAVIENDLRNTTIAEIARALIVKDITCLITVKEVKHGNILLDKLFEYLPPNTPMTFIKGEGTSGKQKMKVLHDLNAKKLKVVIATTVFGEGINVPSLGALINAKAAKSSVDTLQLYGRVLRKHPNKKKVIIVDIADMTTPYLRSHTKARAKIIKTEPAFKVVESKDLFALKEELGI
jgi:superfamily II DNA or RNA helicase